MAAPTGRHRVWRASLLPAILLAVGLTMVPTWAFSETDPFGDPFGALPPNPTTTVELSGEFRYAPAVRFEPDDESDNANAYDPPVFVASAAAADLEVAVSRGLMRFNAAVTLSDSESPLQLRELFARRVGERTDLTVGRFDPSWSAFDLFPAIDFFGSPGLPFVSSSAAAVTGVRVIAYAGPVSAEVIAVPLPEARRSGLTAAAQVFGYEPYPTGVPITFVDAEPSRTLEEVQLAGRLGAGIGPASFYVAGYRGYPTAEVRESTTTFDPEAAAAGEDPIDVVITTVTPMVNAAAGTASLEVLGAVLEAEAVLTIDDPVAVLVTNELPAPIGAVTDRSTVLANTLRIAGRLDWEMVANTRLLMEITDYLVGSPPENLDDASLPGSSVFVGMDVRMPTPTAEYSLTVGSIGDWEGHELSVFGQAGADLLNGLSAGLTAAYLNVGDETDATSDFAIATDGDLLLSLTVAYEF